MRDNNTIKASYKYTTPQGILACWRFWRNCMCTTGWYPVLVAPLLTAGFILSLYSSAGCKFIDIDIGFTPNNLAWNQSEIATIGLFYYYDEIQYIKENTNSNENKYVNTFHKGCVEYTNIFDGTFINKDRTWKVARVMAMVAISSSFIAAITTWLIIFCPLPVNCIWPAIVLPTCMLAFISEGSKFLIFDIALCRNAVWFPSGIDSLPAEAESCLLGESAYYGIAAGIVHLIGLLSICLRAPEKRRLDPNFGIKDDDAEEYDGDFAVIQNNKDSNSNFSRKNKHINNIDEDHSVLDDDMYTSGPSPSSFLHISQDNAIGASIGDTSSLGSNDFLSPMKQQNNKYNNNNGSVSGTASIGSSIGESRYSSGTSRISESRLSVMSKMQMNQSSESTEIIDKLVSDLDSSLQESPPSTTSPPPY